LEQAEQMFRAASGVGTATRPLQVFYGLSQAGRAIAAAARSQSGDEWRLGGHGIAAVDLRAPLPDIEVYAHRKGSFVRLSDVLDSPIFAETQPVALTQLWDSVPENRLWPLRDGQHRRTPLQVTPQNRYRPHPYIIASVIHFPPWVVSSTQAHADLLTYMAAYPEAAGQQPELSGESDPGPRFDQDVDGWGELLMMWEAPGVADADIAGHDRLLLSMTRQYDGKPHFFPAVGSNPRSMHPLMTWWAVLFTLSMLARYQPAEWARQIDVDSSPQAVAIEELLTAAIRIVPRLVAQAIEEVA